ncbi:DUF3558 family protein [Nocardia higoensis]|uniref:DUF3558 family protein n=1 Tax=Nocardia higoensis TaxID=228599 RepID=UPI0002E94B66|nr:DUF3558 family protein [Nocardia higoensis]
MAPALILTACTAEEQSPDATPSGTTTATASSASPTPPPTTTPASADPGDGGAGAGQTDGAQPGLPGGTDTCGATPCGVVDPQPEPSALWDPCDISDADITAQGLRPDSKVALSGSGGVNDKNCRWQSVTGGTELTVVATRQTIEDFQQSGKYLDFSPLTVVGRPAYQYRAAQDSNRIGCYVGVTVPFGVVAFVTRNLQSDAPEEPCSAARRFGNALGVYLH